MVAHSKVKFGQFLIKRTQVYFIRITWVFLDQLFFQKFCKWLPQRVYTLSDLLIDLFRIFTFFLIFHFKFPPKIIVPLITWVEQINNRSLYRRDKFPMLMSWKLAKDTGEIAKDTGEMVMAPIQFFYFQLTK